jgi:RHS repeat-associated protein
LTQRENEASVVEMERDSLGRVVRETVNGRSVQSAYDASGNRTEMTSSLGARVAMSRDGLGQPREMFFGAADGFKEADVRFDRDGLGLESRRAFKNGIEVEWSRDVAGRPTARRTFKKSLAAAAMGFAVGMLATPSFAQPQREEVDARVYQWRGEDQIAGIVDAASGPKFYDHDARGRLVRERRPDVVVERAMDAVGNVYRSRTGTDRRYGPGGRLEMADGVRYEHDEDGNQTLKSGPDGDWHYRWNGHGMLREVERPDGIRVAFDYDPFARRTAKRTLSAAGTVDQEVQFVWDGHNVIHELDSDRGLISWQWEPESFTPIAKEHAGRRWTIASDHLGTPTEMYDDLGQLAWKMQLDVYGVPRFDAGTAEDCPWRWPGQYEDGGIGLFYNRWRYYESHSSLYLSEDPIRLDYGTRLHGYVEDCTLVVDVFGLSGAKQLGANMAAAGRPLAPGMTPHHIVEETRSGIAERTRELLDRHGIDINAEANGARLWGTHPSQVATAGHPGRSAARAAGTYHAGNHIHGEAADRLIYRILRAAERRGLPVDDVLRDIGRRMEAGTWRGSVHSCRG